MGLQRNLSRAAQFNLMNMLGNLFSDESIPVDMNQFNYVKLRAGGLGSLLPSVATDLLNDNEKDALGIGETDLSKDIKIDPQMEPTKEIPRTQRVSLDAAPYKILSFIWPYIKDEYKNLPLNQVDPMTINNAWKKFIKDYSNKNGILDTKTKNKLIDFMWVYNGQGSSVNVFQEHFTGIDRFHRSIFPANQEKIGLTFITRPRLNLQTFNLLGSRRLQILNNNDPNSISFAIRAFLDTNLNNKENDNQYTDLLKICPLIDDNNPFFVPLMNSLTSFTGLPTINIEEDETSIGFFGEGQKFSLGHDSLARGNYELTLGFKEVDGGVISSIFWYWLEYMHCVANGSAFAYPDDIDALTMNYTVSIYRFNMDPTNHYITDWCKCTGCWPKELNIAERLHVNENDNWISRNATQQFTVPFNCAVVEYRDYAIFQDFNTLVRRYCPTINQQIGVDGEFQPYNKVNNSKYGLINTALPNIGTTNFRGIPWITSDDHGIKLEFRLVNNDPANQITEGYLDASQDTVFFNDIDNEEVGTAYHEATWIDQLMQLDVARMLAMWNQNASTASKSEIDVYPDSIGEYRSSLIGDLRSIQETNTSVDHNLGLTGARMGKNIGSTANFGMKVSGEDPLERMAKLIVYERATSSSRGKVTDDVDPSKFQLKGWAKLVNAVSGLF